MDEDEIREWVERMLDELAGIRAEIDGIETAPADLTPVIVIAVLAAVLALGALVAATLALLAARRGARERADEGRHTERMALAAELRRYSQLLGVEAVTGRTATGAESAATLRERLESRAAASADPGALELLDEVRDSRRSLGDLPPDSRAAASGLAGMTVEWSIERWAADPDGWLRDHRERARLQAMGRRAVAAPASGEPEDADTRRR